MNNRSSQLTSLATLCLLLVACTPTGHVTADTKRPLVIGAVLPLSGDFAFFGQETQRGMELARKELEAQGIPVNIIYEDDQTLDPKATVAAGNKLTTIDHVDVIVSLFTDEAEILAPIADDGNVPVVLIWESSEQVHSMGPHVFSTGFSNDKQGIRIAHYAAETLGMHRVVAVQDVAKSADVLAKAFHKAAQEENLTIVADEKTNVGEEDYRALITKLETKQFDAIYLMTYNPEPFLKQAHELGLNTTFLMADSFTSDMLSRVASLNQTMYFTGLSTKNPELITALYRVTYGTEPHYLDVVSLGYDGLQIIGKTNPDYVEEDLVAIIGPTHILDRLESVYTLANGERVLVEG